MKRLTIVGTGSIIEEIVALIDDGCDGCLSWIDEPNQTQLDEYNEHFGDTTIKQWQPILVTEQKGPGAGPEYPKWKAGPWFGSQDDAHVWVVAIRLTEDSENWILWTMNEREVSL